MNNHYNINVIALRIILKNYTISKNSIFVQWKVCVIMCVILTDSEFFIQFS